MSCRCNQPDKSTFKNLGTIALLTVIYSPSRKCGRERRSGRERERESSLWVNKNQKSSYWLWSPLPFEGNPKPGRLWRVALVEAGEEMQCDTNRLKEEVLMDWIKQGGGVDGGGRGGAGWVCGGMTLMFSIDETEKPRCYATHTHTES